MDYKAINGIFFCHMFIHCLYIYVTYMGHFTSSGTTFWSDPASPTWILMKIGSHVGHMDRRKTCTFF